MTWLSDSTELVSGGWLSSTYPGHGALGSVVPAGALLYNDVAFNGLGSNEVRLLITSHNFTTLVVDELGRYSWTTTADGSYTAFGTLYVDGVPQLDALGAPGPYVVLSETS